MKFYENEMILLNINDLKCYSNYVNIIGQM